MSGRRDPCRMSTKELPMVEVVRHVNLFSDSKLSEADWRFGKQSYSRANPPPPVSIWSPFFAMQCSLSDLNTRTQGSAFLARW